MRTSEAFNSQWLNILAQGINIDTTNTGQNAKHMTQLQLKTNRERGPQKQDAGEDTQHTCPGMAAGINMEVC